MRPVDKGKAPRTYTDYGQARHELAERIGYYCSYCEMKVFQSIEVEHILPQNQGGAVLDWDNFLLSCKYCNTLKSDHNSNIIAYFWPDRDNTDLVFDYSEGNVIEPKSTLKDEFKPIAENTINLTGLDRIPSGKNEPTEADTRWRSRKEQWDIAKESFVRWQKAPFPEMAKQIALTSLGGHYSIWMKVFEDQQDVLNEIDEVYKTKYSLFKKLDDEGKREIRTNGLI